MDELRDRLGPLLFQFSYFDRKAFVGVNDFLARLVPFLKSCRKIISSLLRFGIKAG
jgi:hypothetical protein